MTAPAHWLETRVAEPLDESDLLQCAEQFSARLGVAYLEASRVLPMSLDLDTLTVATWLPVASLDTQVLDDLRLVFGVERLRFRMGEESLIKRAIRRTYGKNSVTARGVVEHLSAGADAMLADRRSGTIDDLVQLANEVPVIRLVNLLLLEALDARASDVHLEQTGSRFDVRYRIDGILQEAPSPPGTLAAAVVSRIKIMAELDIAERRIPQDGRVRLRLRDRDVDVRVSIVPSLEGESVVLRLLDQDRERISLDGLGMPQEVRQLYQCAIRSPHGMVLTTGPTGSGKTTTLYASVDCIRTGREKIVAVEDPVEYQLHGVTQIPVNEKLGLTFPVALRALLRQDPDVLLIGEIRDSQTAEIAVQAALTGHLVLSTLHTNDATSALTRLLDLGVPPYLVASTVESVLAQRLVRLNCQGCVEEHPVSEAERAALQLQELSVTMRGQGCSLCRNTGYSGRIGVYELLTMNDELRVLVSNRTPVWQLREAASRTGMISLRTSGERLVQRGLTTLEDMLRAIGSRDSAQRVSVN